MSTKITIGRVDVTEHVAAMFSLAMNSRGYDDEPMYSDEDLEGMLLVAHLAGIEIPAGFDLASVPDAPGRPERPAQQYHGSDGVLITRSHSEQEVLWSAYGEAEGRWYEARQALISATRARLLEQVAAKARAMAADNEAPAEGGPNRVAGALIDAIAMLRGHAADDNPDVERQIYAWEAMLQASAVDA